MATQPLNSTREHHLTRKPIEAEVIAPPQSLAIQRAPEVVLEEASKAAKALRDVIESKPNKVVINGKTFLTFEDWSTLARFYGVTVACRVTNYIEQGRIRGYEAHAEAILVSTGQVIGAAQAMCMDDEQKWHDKPLYQLRSMAQTRAQAKALRGVLAWVAVLAGYNPTPAEEMDGVRIANSPSSQYIPQPRIDQLCVRISNAQDLEELTDVWTRAANEVKRAQDRQALEQIKRVKDARKEVIRAVLRKAKGEL